MFRFKDERDFGACVAASANRRADHPRALRATRGGSLSSGFSSQDRQHGSDDAAADCASLLEFVRALRAQKSRALALDVQTLALSPRRCRTALSALCARYATIRRDASTRPGHSKSRHAVKREL